jgi:4-diphosphocytidyl-2-C-methyl-D-erythritol kinase
MIVFPNAKINIGLRILRRRGDGYHDIESIFYPIGLRDMIEILPSPSGLNDAKPEIYVSGLKVPASTENLCWKAAELFSRRQGTPAVRMHLHKKIPPGSGLGGGSADASFTLMALNGIFGCGLSEEQLSGYATELGSDCAFFIRNRPCLVSGRGDVLETIPLSLDGYYLAVVFPGISVSTPHAYGMVQPSEDGPSLTGIPGLSPDRWGDIAKNRFEEPVFASHPTLEEIKGQLFRSGAAYAAMSGSGSAVYGIFPSPPRLLPGLEKFRIHLERLVPGQG